MMVEWDIHSFSLAKLPKVEVDRCFLVAKEFNSEKPWMIEIQAGDSIYSKNIAQTFLGIGYITQ